MKNTIFIVLITLIFSVVYALLSVPFPFLSFNSLSTIWKTILFALYFYAAASIFTILPTIINGLTKKIAPNIWFAFYSTLLISLIIGIFMIFKFWTMPEFKDNTYGDMNRIALTCLILGIASTFFIKTNIIDADLNLYEDSKLSSIFFVPGFVLLFAFITAKVNFGLVINPNEVYPWYYGFYHGLFIGLHWILSFFTEGIYYKVQNGSTLYNVCWWFAFVYILLTMAGYIYKGLKELYNEFF